MDESLSTELADRAARDQSACRSWLRPGLSASDRSAAAESVEATDRDNAARLREILAEHGWPGHGLVGRAGAHAAWLLAQHAPADLQEECLPLLEEAVARGDASPVELAYLTDRVLMHRGEPQVYGTQYRQVGVGPLELWRVRDAGGLDQRRAALGLEPQEQYGARLLGHS